MGLEGERARKLARTCGRSVTVLARQIASGSASRPEWDDHHQLIPCLLAGAWDASSEHDRDAVTAIAGGRSYEAFEGPLGSYIHMQDPPIDREGEVWKVRAPVDAFVQLARLLGLADLDRFTAVVEKVFSELDPSLDLSEEERPYAAMHGKLLKHSEWLRDGLATTLLLISTMHTEAQMPIPIDPAQFVNSLSNAFPDSARHIDSLPVSRQSCQY